MTTRTTARGAVAAPALAATLTSGCSLVFMKSPSAVDCTADTPLAWTDAVLGLAGLTSATLVYANKGEALVAALALAEGLLHVASSGFGFAWSSRCRSQRDAAIRKHLEERGLFPGVSPAAAPSPSPAPAKQPPRD